MKREELEKLLTDAGVANDKLKTQIDAIMALHGNTINSNNAKNAEQLKALNEQLETLKKKSQEPAEPSKINDLEIERKKLLEDVEKLKKDSLAEIENAKIDLQATLVVGQYQSNFVSAPVVQESLRKSIAQAIRDGKDAKGAIVDFALNNKDVCINPYDKDKGSFMLPQTIEQKQSTEFVKQMDKLNPTYKRETTT